MKQAIFVILGATGDLARKKLIPSIYNLVKKNEIDNFAILGISIEEVKEEDLIEKSKKYVKNFDQKVWNKLKERYSYFQSDFYDGNQFCKLGLAVKSIEDKYQLNGNRIFYLATLPMHFKIIINNLKKCNIVKENNNWTRIVFEKPFGQNLKSAKEINQEIKKAFNEDQIFRIDHYLGKELVQNVSVIRFTNTILEPLWNHEHIDHIQIILSENEGIGQRGAFYDKYGAIKDVVQNHMLQLLALITMNAPKVLVAKDIRDEKVKVLKSVEIEDVVLGQYEGYKNEKGVFKDSNTETLAALKLKIKNSNWKDVPIYLITGKKMSEKSSLIYIQFKKPPCLLFEESCTLINNHLIIKIQPDEGFHIQLNSKMPGKMKIVPVKMDFCHECTFGPDSPEAYENLFLDVINGDQSSFIRTDEIEQQWKIVDNIKKGKIYEYKEGLIPKQANLINWYKE